ncbi:holo-ACP synthase [Lactococcus garvieae]|jgi:holo-[acyl-carrier protein] synthase|uniref:Holo-[acyl-carrier-protein] synthase n=1 Tax=Lactococcus garvieae DCC43 TaxID=1231377 RepID=K2PJV2_9LACT|nr:holo-ACP synthase [Lactococcus garvieae]EKF51640.1 Holo-[acyl-carrier protein] synthase [Lactococcus garvieae DCC43]QPS71362.1 holo-ACP synthase [Lactococcus garvieae]
MIYGIGTDNVEISRIVKALERNEKFAKRVLTASEFTHFESFTSKGRQAEFLAGRWAAKEAFSKALGTGFDSQLSFQHIEISKNEKGKPYFLEHPFAGQAHLSISHSSLEAVAMVVLERRD